MAGERAWRHIEVSVGDFEDQFSHSLGNGMSNLTESNSMIIKPDNLYLIYISEVHVVHL